MDDFCEVDDLPDDAPKYDYKSWKCQLTPHKRMSMSDEFDFKIVLLGLDDSTLPVTAAIADGDDLVASVVNWSFMLQIVTSGFSIPDGSTLSDNVYSLVDYIEKEFSMDLTMSIEPQVIWM